MTKTKIMFCLTLLVSVGLFGTLTFAGNSCDWSAYYTVNPKYPDDRSKDAQQFYSSSMIGQCTWYANGKANSEGWKLVFNPAPGDPLKWWNGLNSKPEIMSAKQGYQGKKGDLMIMKINLSLNHVAYVTSSGVWKGPDPSNRDAKGKPITGIPLPAWTVRHANWYNSDKKGQTLVETHCGYKMVSQCTFVLCKDGKIRIIYNPKGTEVLMEKGYTLVGFLSKK